MRKKTYQDAKVTLRFSRVACGVLSGYKKASMRKDNIEAEQSGILYWENVWTWDDTLVWEGAIWEDVPICEDITEWNDIDIG